MEAVGVSTDVDILAVCIVVPPTLLLFVLCCHLSWLLQYL